MRGLRRTPTQRNLIPSFRGFLWLLAVSAFLVSCGGPPAAEKRAAIQPSPPSPLEELEAKVSTLESRQRQLKQKKAELEEEFARLKKAQENLVALRDEVLEAQRQAAERAAAVKEVEAEALEPQKKVAKRAEAPDVVPPAPGGPGEAPFVVHTSSYRNLNLAVKEANRLARKGVDAFVSEADLGDRGLWYRVLVGRFATADDARSFARDLKERERLSYAAPLRLPYAVALEAYASPDEAKRARAALEKEGLYPYIVKENGPGGSKLYRLRVGAFAKRSEAEAAASRASKAGATPAVVRP